MSVFLPRSLCSCLLLYCLRFCFVCYSVFSSYMFTCLLVLSAPISICLSLSFSSATNVYLSVYLSRLFLFLSFFCFVSVSLFFCLSHCQLFCTISLPPFFKPRISIYVSVCLSFLSIHLSLSLFSYCFIHQSVDLSLPVGLS